MKVFTVEDSDENDFSPSKVTGRIIKHCLSVTSKSREWMEQNPKERLPNDYKTFPGKMDHATCVTIRICDFETALLQKMKNEKI